MQPNRSPLSFPALTPYRLALTAGLFSILGLSCVAPPPTINALSGRNLAIKVFVFGADAEDAKDAFEGIHSNNPTFTVVQNGGDADVLIGIEKDSAKCVEPTALCSYRISYRVRNTKGELLKEDSTTILQDADSCARLCKKVLNKVAVTVVEATAAAVQSGAPAPAASASAEPEATPEPVASTSAAPSASAEAPRPAWMKGVPTAKASASAEPPKPPPPPEAPKAAKGKPSKICSVGEGPKLPPEEAEKRVAQVDALKRLDVLTQEEFDCLRTAYLARL
jgi:hypothetical protein